MSCEQGHNGTLLRTYRTSFERGRTGSSSLKDRRGLRHNHQTSMRFRRREVVTTRTKYDFKEEGTLVPYTRMLGDGEELRNSDSGVNNS